MGKRGKHRKTDATTGERIDQMLGEIELAQSQNAPLEELLKVTSSHFEKEPHLTIPLIEALARIPTPETAQLLTEMMAKTGDKAAVKSIKRALYKLRQRGVRWEERTPKKRPVLTAPKPAQTQGHLGTIDSTGSRIIVISKPQPLRGLLVLFSIVNDLEGIQKFSLNEFSKKRFDEFVNTSFSSTDFPVVAAPGAYCVHILKEASALTRSTSKALPQGYHEAENEFGGNTWDDPSPIIYQFIKEDEVKDRGDLLRESSTLHEIMPFSTWFLPREALQKYAASLGEAQESKIVLSREQKDARINSIYMTALEELFPENKRLLWKRRLEEMAYILHRTGKEREARAALSAAIDLQKPFSSIDPNPFIWNLLLKSIYMLTGDPTGRKEKAGETSLIVTP